MGVNEQQLTNNGTTIDDTVELHRSKRNVWPEIIGEASGVFDALFGEEHGIEGQNVTTAMPPIAKGQNATTQIPPVTRVQNVTTGMPQNYNRDVTSNRSATCEI
ncbi:hypothetical protein [Wolbachia endosymbiont (group E) of Neria commutata]|uniref:hypothetical protein n=1 Tax=Wolbachia endosymbiont (group E) of Neria commutata TaxID=3066149 RepID=UPI003132D66F